MKTVIFDCDGVLTNTEEILAMAEDELLAEYGMHYAPAERRALLTGISHRAHMQRIADDFRNIHGTDLPADFWDRLAARDEELKLTHMKATAGVKELLTALKAAGVKFAVASNTDLPRLEANLKKLGLYDFFAPHVYSRDHVARGKPAPDLYLYAAAKLGARPQDCLVIEDSATGIRAGTAAGMYVVGFTGGYESFPAEPEPLLAAGAKETAATMAEVKNRLFALMKTPAPAPRLRPPPGLSP